MTGTTKGWFAAALRNRDAPSYTSDAPSYTSEVDTDAEPGRRGSSFVARTEPYFVWVGGLVAAALVVGTFAVVLFWVHGVMSSLSPPALAADDSAPAAEQSAPPPPAQADRTSCEEIGGTALRSPLEGVWFQSSCVTATAGSLLAPATNCNQKALDPEQLREVSPGLYVFRQSWGSAGYLWYATSDGCFDLVSARIVTAVCIDLTVSFSWDAGVCSPHGGVLTWVNGP